MEKTQLRGCLLRRMAVLILLGVITAPAWAITDAQRSDAAKKTVASNAACTALPKFYWEIGDRKSVLASGTRGMLPPRQPMRWRSTPPANGCGGLTSTNGASMF